MQTASTFNTDGHEVTFSYINNSNELLAFGSSFPNWIELANYVQHNIFVGSTNTSVISIDTNAEPMDDDIAF